MRRREFLSVLAATAAAWPVAVHAQQLTPVIGVLSTRTLDTNGPLVGAFRRGLAENGFAEGRKSRSSTAEPTASTTGCPRLAAELVRRRLMCS